MGVLQDFERRLEGAVEGFFARAFRSGVQPVELAKALQRYAEGSQHVTEHGTVVPNSYRVRLDPEDLDRLSGLGSSLHAELAEVVRRTADERGWTLRGRPEVSIEPDPDVKFGRYEVQGRVEINDTSGLSAQPGTPQHEAPPLSLSGSAHLVSAGGERHALGGSRVTVGRLPSCDVTLDDGTVSREHAALVRRGDQWWVVDLGSTNGTTVGGVTAAEQPLRPGDRIAFGEAELTFEES